MSKQLGEAISPPGRKILQAVAALAVLAGVAYGGYMYSFKENLVLTTFEKGRQEGLQAGQVIGSQQQQSAVQQLIQQGKLIVSPTLQAEINKEIPQETPQ